MRTWVGAPMERHIEVYGKPDQILERPDGKKIYKYLDHSGVSHCTQFWVVDSRGKIVDQYHEGYCGIS